MSQNKIITSLLKPLLASFAILLLYSSCSEQSFSGGADARQAQDSKKSKNPHVSIDPNKVGGGGPGGPDNGALSTDDGGIVGTPVSRVGLGFEDATDFDYNDIYLCFKGSFSVDGTNIVSNKDQQGVIASWGNDAKNVHYMTIKITDESGKEIFRQGYPGRSKTPVMPTIILSFPRGSKLSVDMDGTVQQTDVGGYPHRAEIKLDSCRHNG